MSDLLSQLGSLSSSLNSASSSSSSSNSSRASSPVDQVVAAFVKTKEKPLNDVKNRITETDRQIGVFNTLSSRIRTLESALDRFSSVENVQKNVKTRKSTSSASDIVTVSSTSSAPVGSMQLRVNRLASTDTLVSDRITNADAAGFAAGALTFQINLDGENYDVSVNFDGDETKEEALRKIGTAINSSTDSKLSASFIKDTTTTGRLSLISASTGQDNAITFTDPDGVLAAFGITNALNSDPLNRTTFTSTSAGFRTANASSLNSEFEVNGITVSRSSNSVDDVIDGMTFSLLKTQEATASPVTVTTEIDTDSIVKNIDGLLSAFNSTLGFFSSLTGNLRNDSTMRSLRNNLRQSATAEYDGDLKYLSELGIRVGTDGSLSVSNKDALKSAVENNSESVATLIKNFSERLTDIVDGIATNDGVVERRQESLRTQSRQLTTRRNEIQQRIDAQAEAYRKQYERLLVSFNQASSQFTYLGNQ